MLLSKSIIFITKKFDSLSTGYRFYVSLVLGFIPIAMFQMGGPWLIVAPILLIFLIAIREYPDIKRK